MNKKTLSQWTISVISLLALIAALVFLNTGQGAGGVSGGPPGAPPGGAPAAAPAAGASNAAPSGEPADRGAAGAANAQAISAAKLSVIRVSSQDYDALVSGFAEATPRYQLALSAAQSGIVTSVSKALTVGSRVAKGEVLVTLENTSQRASIAAAKQSLADSKLALLQEEQQAQQARAEWASSGLEGVPASPLVLREPQLEAARAAVANATAALASTRVTLSQTKITAPFDAVITSRSVSPGQFLGNGTEVATLFSADAVELQLYLDDKQWQLLPQGEVLKELLADIHSLNGTVHWQGQVTGAALALATDTRQRALTIAVAKPFDQQTPLLPGSFVEISVAGKPMSNLWRLPSSARSQQGKVWYVVKGNQLASFTAEPLFTEGDFIYIKPPVALGGQAQQVVKQPLNSYISGMTVDVQEVAL